MYLRKINIAFWTEEPPHWLARDDAIGCQIADLSNRMVENTVSIYAVPDTLPQTLLRLGAALLATRQKLEDVHYLLFDAAVLERVAAEVEKSPGETTDPVVDDWHRDLIHVSGNLLTRLAMELRSLQPERLLREELRAELKLAINSEGRYSKTPQIASKI
jgi:hypothetical protein